MSGHGGVRSQGSVLLVRNIDDRLFEHVSLQDKVDVGEEDQGRQGRVHGVVDVVVDRGVVVWELCAGADISWCSF